MVVCHGNFEKIFSLLIPVVYLILLHCKLLISEIFPLFLFISIFLDGNVSFILTSLALVNFVTSYSFLPISRNSRT